MIYFNSPIKEGGFLNPELNLILELKKIALFKTENYP
jgi:hypothetical protein